MLRFLSLWPLAVSRARSRWQLLLPLLVGSVLAIGLVTSTLVYGDAVRQLGLDHVWAGYGRERLDVNLLAYNATSMSTRAEQVKKEGEAAFSRDIGWAAEDRSRGINSSTFFIVQFGRDGAPIDASARGVAQRIAAADAKETARLQALAKARQEKNQERIDALDAVAPPAARDRAVFMFRDRLLDKMELVRGDMPPAVSAPPAEFAVLITDGAAKRQDLDVGDRFVIFPYWEEGPAVARVSGVLRAIDPADRYWTAEMNREIAALEKDNFVPMFVPEPTMIAVGAQFPKMLADYSWAFYIDPTKVDVRQVGRAEAGLQKMSMEMPAKLGASFLVRTDLDDAINQFQVKDTFGRLALFIVTVMIVAIILYYLVMVAGLVVERQVSEVALLHSRGAKTDQLMALYIWDALIVAVAGLVLGPILATAATAALGYTPVFSGLTDGEALSTKITRDVILMAAAGSVVVFAALLLPTWKTLGSNPMRYKSGLSRPGQELVSSRYSLDVFIAIVAGLLYWELTQQGSVVSATLLGEAVVDKALLAAPALILLAVALLFLRVFPLAVRAAGVVAARLGRVWLVLGMWQMGRNPLPYALPILLLMLASSVAMFSANFGATLSRNYEERARYQAGAEARVVRATNSQGDVPIVRFLPEGVSGTDVFRGRASPALKLFNADSFEFLAVDPKNFAVNAWYRDDFSDKPLPELLKVIEGIGPPAEIGIPIPDNAAYIGVWALATNPRRGVQLRGRVADASGHYQDVTLGNLDQPDWKYLKGSWLVRRPNDPFLTPPLHLVGLRVEATSVPAGAVYLDGLSAGGPKIGDVDLPLYDLQNIQDMKVIHDSRVVLPDTLETSTAVVREGRAISTVFVVASGNGFGARGFLFAPDQGPTAPLPAIASRSFLEQQRVSLDDTLTLTVEGHIIDVQIADVVDFFPTMDPYHGGFLVISKPALFGRVNLVDSGPEKRSSEVWLNATEDSPAVDVGKSLLLVPKGNITSRVAILQSLKTDPLVAAGWDGVLRMAFGAVIFATLMGFSIYTFAQAQRRKGEFAMLRSMGLSFSSLIGIVLVEEFVVIGLGLGLGSWLGVQITGLVMPFLGLNEYGGRVLPPFAVDMDWKAVLLTYGIMLAIFTGATLSLIGVFSRSAISKALRFGDV